MTTKWLQFFQAWILPCKHQNQQKTNTKLQKNKTFNDVIADLYDEGAIFQKWEDKVEEYRAKRERSIHLQGKPGEYLKLIEPLLKKGPAAYFVDPYFFVR